MDSGRRLHAIILSFVGLFSFSVVAFIGSLLSARLLGPGGKGELSAWTIVSSFGALALCLGIPAGIGRFYLQGGERSSIVSSTFLHGVIVLVPSLVMTLILWILNIPLIPLLLFVSLGVPIGVLSQDMLAIFQAAKLKLNYHLPRILNAATFAIGLTIVGAVGVENPKFVAFGLFASGSLLSVMLMISFGWRQFGSGKPTPLRSLATLGRGTYSATILDALLLRLDQLVVGAVIGSHGLGIYGVAVNWAEIGQYLGNAVGLAVFEDRGTLSDIDARRIAVRSAVAVGILMLPASLAAVVLIGPIFGNEFEQARWLVLLLSPGIVARAAAFPASQMLIARGQGRYVAGSTLSALIVGLGAWSAGAALAGVDGAAVANSAVYTVQAVMLLNRLGGFDEEAVRS